MNCLQQQKNDHTAVQKALSDGADVNAKDEKGNTSLHEAAYKGHTETLKTLLDNNANKNAKNNYGNTPADIAKELKRNKISEILNSNNN